MNIYLISLEKDRERRERFTLSFPITSERVRHIQAVDGRQLDAKTYFDKTNNFVYTNNRMMTPSELGCTLSHCFALETF